MPASKKNISTDSLSLRITVVDPPPHIRWALQLGKDEIVEPTSATSHRISFDFSVDVADGEAEGNFRLRGAAVQGKPGQRFVYLRMGTYAGQTDIDAGWRAKIGLEGITRELVEAVRKRGSGRLAVEFAGTNPKGGPACATVPLLGQGWHVE